MKKKNFNIIYMIFILFFSLPSLSYAQSKTITGTVVGTIDNQPLPGASIVVKGMTVGATTDFDGKYTIKAKAGDVLVFSYIGFKAKEVTVSGKTVIDVSLADDTAMLDEIVITGSRAPARSNTKSPLPIDIVSSKDLVSTFVIE
mgnify:CR=1 FL=1